jgi:hypothetical protein
VVILIEAICTVEEIETSFTALSKSTVHKMNLDFRYFNLHPSAYGFLILGFDLIPV